MTVRLPRRTVAALATLIGMFLILVAMVTSVPAGATPPEGSGKPSGSTSSPQPKSNADMNEGGANNGGDCGAYCSTRDGSQSGNGNGGGEAKGKPCAGCVGKADNKNPPGQRPDASDHNNGYECDGNNGIAKTNPAHTGCTTSTPSPTVSPTVTESPTVLPSATESPTVLPTSTESASPEISASVKGVRIDRPAAPSVLPGSLPATGPAVPVAVALALGIGLVAIGLGMTVTSSRR